MRIRSVSFLLFLLLAMGGNAQAQGFYLGAKAGTLWVDDNAFDSTRSGGLLVGYDLAVGSGLQLGVEAEMLETLSDGDFSAFGFKGDWDLETRALYGVLRFGETLYAKARFGVLDEDVSARAAGVSDSASDSGLSYGVGVGWRAHPHAALEIEVTQIEQDISYASVGLVVRF